LARYPQGIGTMNADTRLALTVALFVLVVLAWIAGTVGAVVYACQPGNAGAVLVAGLVAAVGWGFVQEARNAVGECC